MTESSMDAYSKSHDNVTHSPDGDSNGYNLREPPGIPVVSNGSTQAGQSMNGHATEGDPIVGQSPSQGLIAICGMALRLPAGIRTPQQLWEFLLAGGDARGRVPISRYNVAAFHDETGKHGTLNTEYGYFLEDDIGALDTSFFSMPRMEVERMDPQQRLMLEVARECLEDAGEPAWGGKRIGCYIGSLGEDWCEMFARETQDWGPYRYTGFGDFALSNRISYEMDLQGPSMTTRTACSASLVAFHEACVAISRHDCDSAVVGGVNLIMTPGATMSMTEQNVLSRDGSCKTFSADADGYARGEAVTAIYIKRLDHALKDGNSIRAVIRGTATNHDGKTPGFSVPSTKTQETLIRRAYQVAGITDFSKTGYVECHGTGTPVGDPIETSAVGQVFGESGVYIGSIKPNFGHTEGASGLLSVIKTVLALENNIIPPNIKFSRPNPAIPFNSAKLTVAVTPTSWPEGRLQRASVNAFGIGGTNAHAVIDSASSVQAPAASKQSSDDASLLLFSANSKKSLAKMVENYREFAEKKPECTRDLAYTLATKRQHLPYRKFAIASNGTVRAAPSATRSTKPSAIIMVFTGQGAQWPQMGRELLDINEAFRSSIRRLDEYLQSVPLYSFNWGIEAELRKSSKKSRVHQAEFAQPLSTAVQIALVDALETLNIRPTAVVGHSSGEIAAAYAAGALTAEQAIMNAVHRGAVTNLQKRSGMMAAVALSWDEVEKHLVGNVAIACDNSPQSVTISGDVDEVKTVIEHIHRLQPDVSAKKLQIDRAYHSYHMTEIGEQYYALLEDIVKTGKPKKMFFSSVTGCLLDDNAILDSHYWQRNLERPVMFRGAVSSILRHPVGKNPVFLEIGPHSALGGPLRQILAQESSRAPYVSALFRNQNCVESLLSAIGTLWTLQTPIALDKLVPTGLCLSDLPPYPWDHEESYWYETRLSKDYRLRKYPHHDLLGVKIVESTDFEPSWRNLFHLNTAPWVRDHRVGEDIVFPFAAYVAMAGEAIRQIAAIDQTFRLRHIIVSRALVIAEGKPTEMITTLRPHRLTDTLNSKWWEFLIASHNGHTWTKHCTGEVMAQAESLGLSSNFETLPRRVDASKWFDVLKRAGLDLGPEFRKIGVMSAGTIRQQATGEMLNERRDKNNKYHIHPTVIDGALQLVGVAFANGEARKVKNRLPISCDDFSISRSSLNFTVDAAAQLTADSVVGEARGMTAGNIVLSISGLKLRDTDQSHLMETSSIQHAAARQEWGPDIDFLDLKDLVKPLGDISLHTHLLDKLSHLCIVYIRKWLAGSNTGGPHSGNFRRWVEMQFDSLDLSRFGDMDDDTLQERIHDLVHGLADTPATAAAAAMQQICSNLDAVFSDPTASWRDILTAETIAGLHEITTKCDTSSFIQKLAHCKPNLRILEIGSSRSSPSSSLLQNLTLRSGRPCYSKYTFTSKGFVSTHQDSTQLPNLQYATLDINDDPLKQGFELCSYDLIIASNVVHTTRNISASLRNIKRLLHASGYLLLQELCPDTKWINIILGADPGWWCGLEDSRLDEPYISLRQWQKELVAAGFEDASAVVPDSAEPFQLSAVIIAKASNEHDLIPNVTLLCRSITMTSDPVLQELENRGYNVTRCTLHDVPPPGQDVIALLDEDSPFFEDIDVATFEAFKSFLLNLSDSGIFWITRLSQICCKDPRFAQVIGTARTIRSELLIDFATCEMNDINTSTAQLIRVFAKFQRRSTDESLKSDFEYCVYDDTVNIGRFYPFTLSEDLLISRSSDRAMLDVSVPGRPTTLHWVRKPPHPPLQPDEVEVEIYSVGLNFRDVLVAMNIIQLPQGRVFGLEGAGMVRRVGPQVKTLSVGDRVAVVEHGLFATVIITLEILCVKLPDDLSFNEACTMMFPYITAMHSLMDVGGLEKGQSILIHSACGGVGLAAIQLAQMIGADIYATVGTEQKVQHLMETFNISRNRIFNSRDESFKEGIMQATQHNGVDLVLNSLSGDLLHASWQCVAPFGKMIEIGKRDLMGFGKLDMSVFLANRSYCCVDADAFREKPFILNRLLNLTMEYLQKGYISSIRPVQVFDAASPYNAFRYMQPGQHIGRICLSIRNSPECSKLEGTILDQPERLELSSLASYLLVGGLGGLGRSISICMVEHGARHLIYLSRSAGMGPTDELFIHELESMGCEVQIVQGSITNSVDVTRAMKEATHPLKGIIQMSMILCDESFFKMTLDQWNAVSLPKIQGTWNLHNIAIALGIDLDFLVLCSSLSGIIGQSGQASYAAANTFLDAFVQFRANLGLPVSGIDIGAVAHVGYISHNPELMRKMAVMGFKTLSEQQVLDALMMAMTRKTAGQKECSRKDSGFVDSNSFVLGLGSTIPLNSPANRAIWRQDRRMAVYHNAACDNVEDNVASSASLKSYIVSAKADVSILKSGEATAFFASEIGKKLFSLLLKPEEDLDTSLSLADLGMDSLVGIELRDWWKQTFSFDVSVLEMLGKGTLEALGQHAADRLMQAASAEHVKDA